MPSRDSGMLSQDRLAACRDPLTRRWPPKRGPGPVPRTPLTRRWPLRMHRRIVLQQASTLTHTCAHAPACVSGLSDATGMAPKRAPWPSTQGHPTGYGHTLTIHLRVGAITGCIPWAIHPLCIHLVSVVLAVLATFGTFRHFPSEIYPVCP